MSIEYKKKSQIILEGLKPIADAIYKTFGNNVEVVIHDLSHPDSSLIYMAGNITNRQIGSPITNIVLEKIRKEGDDAKDLINYITYTKDGKEVKSSTIFIRDDHGKIIGTLCINVDITFLKGAYRILENMLFNNEEQESIGEEFVKDIGEFLSTTINWAINEIGKPLAVMEKEDKLKIIKLLDEKGIFFIKGSVEKLAKILGVSRYSIYNYIEEIRNF